MKVLTVRELHTMAMDATQDAMEARRIGGDHISLYSEAYELERRALNMVLENSRADSEKEPTRGVIARSAGWLAYNAERYTEALECAEIGLAGAPYFQVRLELEELVSAVRNADAPE